MGNNEQWKEGGDCSKCRRQNYCGNECRLHRNRLRSMVKNFVCNKLENTHPRIVEAMKENEEKYGF
jgi:sulfatase maturation enzyme AslB (radical SAM superfamily)